MAYSSPSKPLRVTSVETLRCGAGLRDFCFVKMSTFFYACEARPPFSIRAVTPLVNFGWSPVLEYLTHIELHGDQLHVSLGVADCRGAACSCDCR